MTELDKNAIHKRLEKIANWKLVKDIWIKREFTFTNFQQSMKFVNSVANYAEEKGHHPFISINYHVVELKLTSLEERRLTIIDIEMAEHFDILYREMKK